jgi:hypothetical protein
VTSPQKGRALLAIVGVGNSLESGTILGSKLFPSSRVDALRKHGLWFLHIFLFYYIISSWGVFVLFLYFI